MRIRASPSKPFTVEVSHDTCSLYEVAMLLPFWRMHVRNRSKLELGSLHRRIGEQTSQQAYVFRECFGRYGSRHKYMGALVQDTSKFSAEACKPV